jgi:hypothetical protein
MNVLRKAALAAVLLGAAAPVTASANCFGSASTATVCLFTENVAVDPDGGQHVEDCVIVADPEHCVPVGATLPSVTTTGPLYSATCHVCSEVPGVVDTVTGVVGTATRIAGPFVDRAYEIADQATRMKCAPARSTRTSDAREDPFDNLDEFLDSCL